MGRVRGDGSDNRFGIAITRTVPQFLELLKANFNVGPSQFALVPTKGGMRYDSAVDLGECVPERREISGLRDLQRGRGREAVLEARLERHVGLVHEGGADATGAEVVDRELEQRLEQLSVGERLALPSLPR